MLTGNTHDDFLRLENRILKLERKKPSGPEEFSYRLQDSDLGTGWFVESGPWGNVHRIGNLIYWSGQIVCNTATPDQQIINNEAGLPEWTVADDWVRATVFSAFGSGFSRKYHLFGSFGDFTLSSNHFNGSAGFDQVFSGLPLVLNTLIYPAHTLQS